MKKILHMNNIISNVECEKYIDWIENNIEKFLFLDHRQRYMFRFGYDQEYPNDTSYDLNKLGSIKNNIIELLNNIIDIVKENFEEKDLYVGSFFISKHLPGSAVPAHFDGGKEFNEPLHYSALIYLNELPNSGSLFFNIRNVTIHPKSGDLIAFDTHGPLNMHSVPDVDAPRYSIPIWLTKDKDFNLLQDAHMPNQE